MFVIPGASVTFLFFVRGPDNNLIDADVDPPLVLYRNGGVDGAVTVTPANVAGVGFYTGQFTTPGGYVANDILQVKGVATIAGVDDTRIVFEAVVQNATGLSASDIRAAIGLSFPNLDTQLAALLTQIGLRLLTSGYTAPDNTTIGNIYTKVDTEIATILAGVSALQSGVFAQVIEGSTTFIEVLRLLAAAEGGATTGGAANPFKLKSLDGTKDRVVANTDTDGNRTIVSRDLS